MSDHEVSFSLNGKPVTVRVPADRLLLDVLRDDLGLTGTKEGCSVGVCGLCSVLLDGEVMSSCLLPAVFISGSAVQTVEGLAQGHRLTALQEAFIRHGGFQCGICTPGQLLAATALLNEIPQPSPDDVREYMLGNLCRCTGYYGIIDSILAAAANVAEEGGPG